MIIKRFSLALAAVLGLFAGTRTDAAITLGLSSVEDAGIQFAGSVSQGTVTFINGPSGNSFSITTVDDGPGSPSGLFGTISGSFTYQFAEISSFGPPKMPLQMAELTGSGELRIGTSVDDELTADIVGIDVFSFGSTGGYNGISSSVNLTNVVYNGQNQALIQLRDEANAGGGIVSISYQFGSAKSLKSLAAADHTIATTYSGTITTGPIPVPEPGTLGMAVSGVALVGLGYYRKRSGTPV